MRNADIIREELIKWGKENIDNFPWREPESLYELVVAEIMLIRTPPEQVLPVYNNFLKKYPDEKSLAREKLIIIEKRIRSLGLKWRADRLKSMATFLCEHKLFEDADINKIKKIPGVGDYTGAAILIYFYNKRAVPVDSNTVRFFERVYDQDFSGEARRNKNLRMMMDRLVPEKEKASVEFNEAFLDFMRKVCTPEKPLCNECALAEVDICIYYERN